MNNLSNVYTGLERRKHPRLELASRRLIFIVYYSFIEEGFGKQLSIVRNISAGGICIIVNETIKEATLLDLTINFLDYKFPIQIKGRVVWWRNRTVESWCPKDMQYEMGIEFTEIKDEDRQKISRYVMRLLNNSK